MPFSLQITMQEPSSSNPFPHAAMQQASSASTETRDCRSSLGKTLDTTHPDTETGTPSPLSPLEVERICRAFIRLILAKEITNNAD
jgi:hypothetical protein